MKAVFFDYSFEPPDELNEFCKSIGYQHPYYYNNYDLMFDQRVVAFCEERLSSIGDEMAYKGKETYRFRCGFAGAGYILDVDITKKWRLKHTLVGAPMIDYVDVKTNSYGRVSFVSVK